MKKVCSKTAAWIFVLMLIVPGSFLTAEDPPSAHEQAVRKAQPVTATLVPPALHEALASTLDVAVSFGPKAIPTPPTGTWGIVSEGDGGGGIFRDSDSEAEAWLGTDSYGVQGFGSVMGGHFADSDSSGYAYVGNGDYGIAAWGSTMGGYFKDYDSPSYAYAGFGNYGIQAAGNSAGGYFIDYDSSGYAWVGYGDRGIEAYGTEMGGYFKDSDATGYAYVGYGDRGIWGYGEFAGGYFADSNGTGIAHVGRGDRGIWGYGEFAGGYFEDSNGTGYAHVGYGDRGIEAYGNETGGYFKDVDGSGYAHVGFGDRGIEASGTEMGGYFSDSNGTGFAQVGIGNFGIRAEGGTAGGRFADATASGYADVGYGDYGIQAWGETMGGYFADSGASGRAWAGSGDHGIEAYGNDAGGYFVDLDGSGGAYVGYGSWGIEAWGDSMGGGGSFSCSDGSGSAKVGFWDYGITAWGDDWGGSFSSSTTSAYAHVGYSSYKIFGFGSVSFVQNHPYDSSSVIVYAAPEGDEIATYTRGTARLVEGEATVPLGETFKWVTNPDLGLTAFLTPVSQWCDLFVVEQATDSIVVRSRDGSDCGFNYMVYGLRIGFEESSIVQEKEMESYIPSMTDHRQLYERRPDLKSYNSLERFKGMQHEINPKAKLDLSRAEALRDAIVEFDPAVHELPRPPGFEEMTREDATEGNEGHGEGVQGGERVRPIRADQDRRLAPDHSSLNAAVPVDDEGNVYATSFRPSFQDLASLVDVSEEVQPGDVLVIDRGNPGMMRKAFEAHDTGVIGVVALDAGVVAGTQPPATEMIEEGVAPFHRAAVGVAGVVTCNVDAAYGAVWPGDFLVTSPTPGHAMRADTPLPGATLGKALEPLREGVGTIKVFVMLR